MRKPKDYLFDLLSFEFYENYEVKLMIHTKTVRNTFRVNGKEQVLKRLKTKDYQFKLIKVLPQHKLIILEVEE